MIRRLIGIEVTDLLETTERRLQESGSQSAETIQLLPYNVIGFSDSLSAMNRQLKSFLYQNMYQHHRVVQMQIKAARILEDLFDSYAAHPELLSREVQERAGAGDLHRTICDYIAGMTDRFALQEHDKLFNPATRP
jgi:dGTPase